MKARRTLNRRTVLRGLLGGAAVAVALPPLEAMLNFNGNAYADGERIPKRFGIFFWGNGVKLDRWTPSQTGPNYPLTDSLQPLADVRDYVSVVSGMDIKTGNERGHHAGCVGILSGAPMIPQDPRGAPYCSTFSAKSIDQVVADALMARGEETPLRSLEVGVTRHVVTGEGTTLRYLSHNGQDNANEPDYSPAAVFDRIFGADFVDPMTTQQVNKKLGLRRSVLDAVRADATALQNKVGYSDRVRLTQHFESVRQLERKIALIESMPPPPDTCSRPARPSNYNEYDYTAISEAMADLVTMAFACDQTRVFSNMFSGGVSLAVYRGIDDTNHHSLTHDEGGDQPHVQSITRYIMQQFAYQLDSLRRVPVGDGNLLDHCAILASSDTSDGRAHRIDDYPILVAGGAGGRLRTPGVHVRRFGENTSNVLLSLLNAMDIEVSEFGVRGGRTTQTVSEILV